MKTSKLLLSALVCICALFATSCEDEKDTTIYPYNINFEISDPGDLTADQKMILNTTFAIVENEFGTIEIAKSDAQSTFEKTAPEFTKAFQKGIGSHKQEAKIRYELYNAQTKQVDFSTELVLLPQ